MIVCIPIFIANMHAWLQALAEFLFISPLVGKPHYAMWKLVR